MIHLRINTDNDTFVSFKWIWKLQKLLTSISMSNRFYCVIIITCRTVLQVHGGFFCFLTSRLKKFFFDAGNMAYVKALVHVPVLPQVWCGIVSALSLLRKGGYFANTFTFWMIFGLVEIQLNPIYTYGIFYYYRPYSV